MQTLILLQNEIAPLPKLYDEIAPPYVTPIDVMLSSSSFTQSRRGKGIFVAVNRAWGLASALSLIVYASPRFPRPLKRSGYLHPSSIVSTLATMLSAVIAGRPNKLVLRPLQHR